MTPIRAYMLIIDSEPSLEDILPTADEVKGRRQQLRPDYDSVEVVPVEIREVRDADGN